MRIDLLVFAGVLAAAIAFAVIYRPAGEETPPPTEAGDQTASAPAPEDGIAAGDADGDGTEPVVGDVLRGKELATSLCGGCHAIPPATVSPQPPAPPFDEVAGRWPLDDLAEALAEGIVVAHEGHVIMPEFSFDPQQVEDLLTYMDSLRG